MRRTHGRQRWRRQLGYVALLLSSLRLYAAEPEPMPRGDMILVLGLGGEARYEELFMQWADTLEGVARQAPMQVIRIGPEAETEGRSVKDSLYDALEALKSQEARELWVVMVGHGTFDGRRALFNLKGPDLAAEELSAWLDTVERPVAVVNTSSASAPFLKALSGQGRVVLTATRSGFELSFARFGSYLVEALQGREGDLDKDGQTSLLEAFLMASHRVGEYYQLDGRLLAEHAMLEDTGDALGVEADWFEGLRVIKETTGDQQVDGRRAHQWHLVESALERHLPPDIKERRDALEQKMVALRDRKDAMSLDEYYQALEALLIPFAELYESVVATTPSPPTSKPESTQHDP